MITPDFLGQCRVVAQIDVVQDLNAIGIAPELIADAVGFQQVFRHLGARFKEVDQDQSNDHRGHGGEQVGDDRFDAEAPELGGVAQARYS